MTSSPEELLFRGGLTKEERQTVVNFSNIDYTERPVLILKNASETPLCVLGLAYNVSLDLKYNETSTIEFTIPAVDDLGNDIPYYDDVVGMRIVEVKDVGQFTLTQPTETKDGAKRYKTVKGYSLEYEFTYKKLSLEESTFRFYDPDGIEESILAIIMERMPSWTIGSVSPSLNKKYRTFSLNNENLYNFIKNTAQQTFGCIFDFDTMNRVVNVRDINDEPVQRAVYISPENLAKTIEVEEDTESVVTRLDVNGADDLNIRDVNPAGTNKIINLDYFMTTKNFPQALITKYRAWKALFDSNVDSYYDLSIQYTLKVMEKTSQEAALTDLKADLTNIDNQRGVTIEAIAQGLQPQSALDTLNVQYAAKQTEITAKEAEIATLETERIALMAQLQAIRDECSFEDYFTDEEYLQLDRYIRDGDITESSFVITNTDTYLTDSVSEDMAQKMVDVSRTNITHTVDAAQRDVYTLVCGALTLGSEVTGNVVSATFTIDDGSFVGSVYLSNGHAPTGDYTSACMTMTGEVGTITYTPSTDEFTDGAFICPFTSGHLFFTLDVSEYQRRTVAHDLFKFGAETLAKLSQPSYTFNVTSANFLALDDFLLFKQQLLLGQKIYMEQGDGRVLQPIATGVSISYDEVDSFTLTFSDSYTSSDSSFKLVDLLEQSVSMGKNVELSKYAYAAFVDSGADTGIKNRLTSAIDVARNEVMSSSSQAVSWDSSGLHMRKWSDATQVSYNPEQIWISNNSILMTDDSWATARMAIGKFRDPQLGTCWGIVAPMIVGTMIAGSELVIESEAKSGGTSVFRVDADGCALNNADFTITKAVGSDTMQIVLSPDLGIVIGNSPVYTESGGTKTINTANAKFYADSNGDLHLTGGISATSLSILSNGSYVTADNYVKFVVDDTYILSEISGTLDDYLEKADFTSTLEQNASSIVAAVTASGDFYEKQSVVEITATGISLTSGGNISLQGGTLSLGSSASIAISSGSSFSVVSGGTVEINASGNNDSYIYFGNDVRISKLGGVMANTGSFGSLSVGGLPVLIKSDEVNYKIMVSSGMPSETGVLWIQPSTASSVSYRVQTDSVPYADRCLYQDEPVTIALSPMSPDTLSGTIRYGLTIPIRVMSETEHVYNMTISAVAVKQNTGETITFDPVTAVDIGPYERQEITMTAPATAQNNLCATTDPINVSITVHSTVDRPLYLRIESGRYVTLTCNGSGAGSGVQSCGVFYIPGT